MPVAILILGKRHLDSKRQKTPALYLATEKQWACLWGGDPEFVTHQIRHDDYLRVMRTRHDTSLLNFLGISLTDTLWIVSQIIRVKGPILEKWQELCARAAKEQDPDTLMQLVAEINKLLAEKEERLRKSEFSISE